MALRVEGEGAEVRRQLRPSGCMLRIEGGGAGVRRHVHLWGGVLRAQEEVLQAGRAQEELLQAGKEARPTCWSPSLPPSWRQLGRACLLLPC